MKLRMLKVLSLVTAIVLLLSVFSGCGSATGGNGGSTTTTAPAGTTQSTTSATEPVSKNLISEKPLELTMFRHNHQELVYTEDMPIWKIIADKTNIKIKFKTVGGSWEDFNSALQLEMNSGAECDLYWGGLPELNQHGDTGAFIEISDLVKEHAPNIQKYIADDKEAYALTTSMSGKLYALPSYFSNRSMYGFYVRQDWLDKLSLKAPETIDDWITMLKAFRDNDPNGNGKNDELPYVAREKFVALLPFASAFNTDNGFVVKDGKVVYGPSQPEYKEFLTFINLMFKEKLLDNEFFTRPGTILDQSIENNTVGATFDWIGMVEQNSQKFGSGVPGMKFTCVKPPFVPGKSEPKINMARDKVGGSSIAISVKNKYPVESVKFLNYLYSDEMTDLFNYGIEGEHYTIVNGKPKFTEAMLKEPDLLKVLREAGSGNWPFISSLDAANQVTTIPEVITARNMYESIVVPGFPLLSLKYAPEKLGQLYNIFTAIGGYQEGAYAKFIFGQESLDNYDAFVKELYNLGLQEMLDIVSEAYAKY